MGYPNNLKASIRKVTDNIVTASCQFSLLDKLNLGARMALIKNEHGIVVWSAIPYGEEVVKALELLTGRKESEDEPFEVKYLLIPNIQHAMAVKSLKEKYPQMKIIGMEHLHIDGLDVDYTFTEKESNKVLDKAALEKVGIVDPVITDHFQFVYLSYHKNKELVPFNLTSKTLFEADMMSNLGISGTTSGDIILEQYSKETGFSGTNPHSGWSFITRYLQPYSAVGCYLNNRLSNSVKSKEGLKAILSWDFNRIVLCHGNIIEENAKKAFSYVFKNALES